MTKWAGYQRLVAAIVVCCLLGEARAGSAAAAEPCDARLGCALTHGRYFAYLPAAPARSILMFFHGFGSSARHELDTPACRRWAEDAGAILLIPDGIDARWSVIDGLAAARDEIAFAGAVMADARARLPLGALPVYASGFSLGASMVWRLACAGQPSVAGYITFSGAFWEPAPLGCATLSAPLLHFHGTDDTVVPLEGRQVRSGRRQAPLEKAFAAMSRTATCTELAKPRPISGRPPALDCEEQIECAAGRIGYCRHSLGHNFEINWLSFAMAHMQGKRY